MKFLFQKINNYFWQGINQQGQRISGISHAANISSVITELRQQAITPLAVRKKFFILQRTAKIKQEHIVDFTRQLATLVNAGIALVPALQILNQSHENLALQTLIFKIETEIESGNSLSEAIKKYPEYFDSLYCNLVYIGEQSGTLNIMLTQIATYKEKLALLAKKLKKALIYPATVITTAILVTALILIFVVPQFKSMFEGFGAELPFYTQLVITISEKLKAISWFFLVSPFVFLFLFKWCRKHPAYSYQLDKFLLRLPCIGNLLIKDILARFTRTLAITFNAGLPLTDALQIIANSCGNLLYTQAIVQIHHQVVAGQAIHKAMQNTGMFPPRVIQMIAIAEESGTMIVMSNKIADFYEQQVDYTVENLTKLLEPAVMIILGIIIGGLITAMYLPIFRLGSVI
jgi:type IV pilus assembly protein PilC